jgi:hypothetical protein
MTTLLFKRTAAMAALMLAGMVGAFAAPYAKGDRVDAFTVKTQHGEAVEFKASESKFLLVSHDMETGKKANAVLTTLGKEELAKRKTVYLANIFGMPGIGRMFAMPKMRRYSHTILLGDDAGLIARFPEQAGKVTVLKLEGGKVGSVDYWSPGQEALDDKLK